MSIIIHVAFFLNKNASFVPLRLVFRTVLHSVIGNQRTLDANNLAQLEFRLDFCVVGLASVFYFKYRALESDLAA